ncbi:MAG: hypothetical protein ABIL01_16970 [Pseudomonadota bacterium]
MADRRLRQSEAVTGGGEASQIPDREKDPQEIEVESIIRFIHDANYNYEFDLAQCFMKITSIRPTTAGNSRMIMRRLGFPRCDLIAARLIQDPLRTRIRKALLPVTAS